MSESSPALAAVPAGAALKIVAGASSHEGNVRPVNEDSYLARRPCYIVADGMGGHSLGDVASQAAVTALNPLVGSDWAEREAVREAIREARAAIAGLAEAGQTRAPGTTITGASVVLENGVPCWYIVNIGDSRTYLWRAGRLQQITVDHSARSLHPGSGLPRNIITRAIGAGLHAQAAPDEWLIPIQQGDAILACSDGLYTEVPEVDLSEILTRALGDASGAENVAGAGAGAGAEVATQQLQEIAAKAAADLVNAALSNEGKDNVTAVVALAARLELSAASSLQDDATLPDPFSEDDTRDDLEFGFDDTQRENSSLGGAANE